LPALYNPFFNQAAVTRRKTLAMRQRFSLLLICGYSMMLNSCGRPAQKTEQAQAVAATAAQANDPDAVSPLTINNHRKHDLQLGMQLHTWKIQVQGIKEMTTTLLVIRDGDVQTVYKIEDKWEKWDSSQPPVTGEIVFVTQNGQPFGIADKLFPQMTVDLLQTPDCTRVKSNNPVPIEGILVPGLSIASDAGGLGNSGLKVKNFLFAELLTPPNEQNSGFLAPDLEGLKRIARSGRVIIAITVEWVCE
jgi:hypothetical protein